MDSKIAFKTSLAAVSPWSLQINKSDMQTAFIKYIRRSVRKKTNIMLSVQSVIGLLFLGVSISETAN